MLDFTAVFESRTVIDSAEIKRIDTRYWYNRKRHRRPACVWFLNITILMSFVRNAL